MGRSRRFDSRSPWPLLDLAPRDGDASLLSGPQGRRVAPHTDHRTCAHKGAPARAPGPCPRPTRRHPELAACICPGPRSPPSGMLPATRGMVRGTVRSGPGVGRPSGSVTYPVHTRRNPSNNRGSPDAVAAGRPLDAVPIVDELVTVHNRPCLVWVRGVRKHLTLTGSPNRQFGGLTS
jgi:hypothetical protein